MITNNIDEILEAITPEIYSDTSDDYEFDGEPIPEMPEMSEDDIAWFEGLDSGDWVSSSLPTDAAPEARELPF